MRESLDPSPYYIAQRAMWETVGGAASDADEYRPGRPSDRITLSMAPPRYLTTSLANGAKEAGRHHHPEGQGAWDQMDTKGC